MIGIEDFWVALPYVLCLAGAALCLGYGWLNWNRGDETVQEEDVHWAAKEDKEDL